MKKIAAFLVLCIMVTSLSVFASTDTRTITAEFNRVQVVIDGVPSAKETLLYDGRTYMQIRDAAETLGLEVTWIEETDTAALDRVYPDTYADLMAAVTGETQANANYNAFSAAAAEEGYPEVSAIFKAIAAAELQHATDEFAIASSLSDVVKPTPGTPEPGTTAENLKAAVNGETAEYTEMYPGFVGDATDENMLDARGIFTLAMRAEEVHAGIYKDLLDSLDNFDAEKYGVIYRCPVCGNILTSRPKNCPICGDQGEDLIEYNIVPVG